MRYQPSYCTTIQRRLQFLAVLLKIRKRASYRCSHNVIGCSAAAAAAVGAKRTPKHHRLIIFGVYSRQIQASQRSRLLRLSRKLLLPLLLSVSLGFGGIIGVYGDNENEEDNAKVQIGTIASTPPHRPDSPDVTFGREDDRSGGGPPEAKNTDGEPVSPVDERSRSGGVLHPEKGGPEGGGGLLSPLESAEELLADGEPRCFLVDGATSEEEGEATQGLLCLPTLFFMGVSKCGEAGL